MGISSVKIVEKNAGFENSLVLTYVDDSGQMKGVVVAWNVNKYIGQTFDVSSLIPVGATNVQFAVIPNGGKAGANPSSQIQDIASATPGDPPTVFDIEGDATTGAMREVKFNGIEIKGAAGTDLILQSESKNPARDAGEDFGDADDYVLGDESGSNDGTNKEVNPATPKFAGDRDMNTNPLGARQLGFEDRFEKSDGDFNDLIIEVTTTTEPVDVPQTATETTTLPNGQTLTVQMTGPTTVASTPFDVSALLSLSGVEGGEVNFLFIVDESGSTSASGPTTGATVGDVNGDGSSNRYLDYELAGVLAVQQAIAALGSGFDFDLGYIDFASSAGSPFLFEGGDDLIQELIDAGRRPSSGGGTDFEDPLQQAISFFNTVDPDQNGRNFVLFLSDGQASTSRLADELATLQESSGINAFIKAVGFGTGADKSALDVIDSEDDALIIVDPADLPNLLPDLTPVDPDDIDSVELFVNGTLEDTFAATDLTAVPGVGLSLDSVTINTAILGDGLADLIQLVVNTSDGGTLTTAFYVGEAGEAEDYVLNSAQVPVDYIKGFSATEGDRLVLNFATGTLALQATSGGDGDDFDLVDTGSGDVIVQFVDAVGVTTVDDLFPVLV